ncbi:enoyl-CoA hydratase-related protein [Catellatospora vulcania]|uniref:enoyl-CoA hydratase-related protein n=1 Tax=Catellatospora vulcania TaxID=1460450 RepID=UPI0012D37603|nr:enoyl-CoA hydratase-related protein [Catellatospora vulcania]
MGYETIETAPRNATLTITLRRPEAENSIDDTMVRELGEALDEAEADAACRVVVIEGGDGVFSTGMDLVGAADGMVDHDRATRGGAAFFGLLKRLTTIPRVVVAKVDGRVAGGGVGLAAASDFVFATPRSTFSLPEALWGLLPCCVAPFLIRRVGFQKAYAMSLSTQPVSALQAEACSLADQVSGDLDPVVRRLTFRSSKLQESTIADLKRYYARMWIMSAETEQAAVGELARLMSSGDVKGRLSDFARRQRFPWEG